MALDDSSSDSSSSSASINNEERFLPSHKGWQGRDLELEHSRESFQLSKANQVAAVDIRQFQNIEVGKGYQAKHVVRQQQADKPTVTNIQDMSRKKRTRDDDDDDEEEEEPKKKQDNNDNSKIRLKKYTSSPGFVMFRREIEEILS